MYYNKLHTYIPITYNHITHNNYRTEQNIIDHTNLLY